MDLAKHLTCGKFYIMFDCSKDGALPEHKEAVALAIGLKVSSINKWLQRYQTDPDDRLFKKDRNGTAPLVLQAFGIAEADYEKITLSDEDFRCWFLSKNPCKATVYIGFDNIIDAMNEEIGEAESHVWLYRSHGTANKGTANKGAASNSSEQDTAAGTTKGIVDTLDQKLNCEEKPLQIIKRIVTLYQEETDDLQRICEHFVRMFYGHNNVHLKAIDKGYLGINLLIVDNKVALFCLPDDSGHSVGYALRVEDRDLIISLQWLYKRIESRSLPIIEPHSAPRKREDVLAQLVSLISEVNNPVPALAGEERPDCDISKTPPLEEKTYDLNLEFLPNYRTYMQEMRKALDATSRSCWLYRSHRSDGKSDKPFIDAFIEKCKEVRKRESDVDVCSFKRIVYYFDNDHLRNELDRCIQYMENVENATLGVVEHQIDSLNLAIFDSSTVFLGFHDDDASAVLCGLKITDPDLVTGFINMYHRLESKMDRPLLSEKDMERRKQQKTRALEYVSNGC